MDIQRLIDACHAAGGGVVTLPPGTYQCGTLFLKDGVTLHLEQGATILGSGSLADYPPPSDGFCDGCDLKQKRGRALIAACGAKNIAVIGPGTIQGNGQAFCKDTGQYAERPFMLRLVSCRSVRLENLHLEQAAAWCCVLQDCEDVQIQGLHIVNHGNSNNDGLDLDSCRRVQVAGCDIDSDDDALCLKATFSTPVEDIDISGCRLKSLGAALKFGTESYGDFRRVTCHNCQVTGGNMGAVKIMTVDGGILEDVEIADLDIQSAVMPVFLRCGARRKVYRSGQKPKGPSVLRRITLRRIHGRIHAHKGIIAPDCEEPLPPCAHTCLAALGIQGHPVQQVLCEDCELELPGGNFTSWPDLQQVPEREDGYPEIGFFGVMPASCLCLKHTENMTFRNCRFTLTTPDSRPRVAEWDTTGTSLQV